MRRVHRLAVTIALAGLAFPLAACSGSESPAPESSRSTVASSGTVRDAILPADDLPAGWRYATQEQFLGKPEMCDVVLEPPGLVGATTQRFTTQSADRFVIQYSFLSDDESATAERIDEFAQKAPSCTSFSPGDGVTLDVSAIDDVGPVGESFGAVHAEDPATPANQRDYVVFRNGAHVTVLISYGVSELASRAELDAIAQAVQQHVATVVQ